MPRIVENNNKIKRKFLLRSFRSLWLWFRYQIYEIQKQIQNQKKMLIWGFLVMLITIPVSDLWNSEWRIQYDGWNSVENDKI